MESSLGESSSPIVFSHNDALPANMVIIMIMISWYISLWWRWYVPAIFASQHDDDDDVDYVIIIVEIKLWWQWDNKGVHNYDDNCDQVVTDIGKVRLIDLEYSGPNYAAFDIANLFNEYDEDDDICIMLKCLYVTKIVEK